MTYHLSPTTALPALATLHSCDAARVGEALQALRDLYFPHTSQRTPIYAVPVLKQSLSDTVRVLRPKRIAHLVHHDGVPDSGYASAEEDEEIMDEEDIEDEDEALDLLRSDELERGYSIKWLTGLVKRGDAWICGTLDVPSSEERDLRAAQLDDASRLLARFAGDDTPEEALVRKFVFPFRTLSCRCQGLPAAPPITVELNDAPVDGTDHTAVGLQSWGSAILFAERMCFDPERYLGVCLLERCSCTSAITKNAKMKTTEPRLRLLELGSGTGLLSITAAQILSRMSVLGEIKATDYHPSVLQNLACNVLRNPSTANMSVEKLDWADEDGRVGEYDIVLAADVVYHPEHASWIRGCVGRTLKKGGVFWLIIPVRTIGRHEGLEETVEAVFSAIGEKGCLAIVNREDIERVDGVGRADEGGYTLFEIRWS